MIYYLVLAFSIAGALQASVYHLRISTFPQTRRTVFGLILLLSLQFLLFIVGGLVWQGFLNPQVVMPPLDRAVTLLSLIWIAWLWAFPEPVRMADAATLLLTLVTLTLLTLVILFWGPQSMSGGFNLSVFETTWQALTLAVAALGIIAVSIRRPNGWANGLVILIILISGHIITLFAPGEGDFPGAVRIAQVIAYPILMTISHRFPIPASPLPRVTRQPDIPIPDRRRYSTDPKTFHALLNLAAESNSEKIARAIVRSVAQAMMADLCFLLTISSEDKNLVIACGYDLIREESLDGTVVSKDEIPLLASALQRGRALRLPASSTSSDLKGLGTILGLSSPGHLLSVPIANDRGPLGGIMILSPYSNRLWGADDQAYLSNVAPLMVPILERAHKLNSLETECQQHQKLVEETEKKLVEYRKAAEAAETSQTSVQAESLATLVTSQEESLKTIAELKAENEELQKKIEGKVPASGDRQIEDELRLTLEEVAYLQNSLAEANVKILDMEQHLNTPISNEQAEIISSISQELRQPMSSIVGYTDLLMGESVGILGALQRKFVERIKASTERIGNLVDDLIQLTSLDAGQIEMRPEPVDINLIVDNALAYTSTQIREKNITMRLDLPDIPSQIQTDREAIQQILIHLLQNATAATEVEGTITLRMQLTDENDHKFLLIQVIDSGGGIGVEDIPRVFARRYRADNSLIQGLGDTGVGLSIAKAMVEAQHGRIWVDSNHGIGSTFSLLLPVQILEPEEQDA